MSGPDFLNITTPPGWMADGVCGQVDPELWFPEMGGSPREAKQLCRGCVVRAECLSYALAHGERFGVWGGVSEQERRRLTRAADHPSAGPPVRRRPGVSVAGPVSGVDEVVVDRLISGQSVTGASRVEVAQAAIGLRHASHSTRRIAAQLGVHPRQVHRWLARHQRCPRCPDQKAA